jgi:hypothetical protein
LAAPEVPRGTERAPVSGELHAGWPRFLALPFQAHEGHGHLSSIGTPAAGEDRAA